MEAKREILYEGQGRGCKSVSQASLQKSTVMSMSARRGESQSQIEGEEADRENDKKQKDSGNRQSSIG